MADTSCSDSDLERCIGGNGGKDGQNQKDLVMLGSTALLNNSPLEAVDNYKSALDKIHSKPHQKIPMALLVLRYALCIALLKCNTYQHFVEAIKNLRELIDSNCGNKLPAVYLALAKAYYALNRFKKALKYVETGLKINQSSKAKQHAWPGLLQTIEETGRDYLQKALLGLQTDCKNFNPPDAVCGYDKCKDISSHVDPSEDIYFSDPDFKPFFSLQCDAKCKIVYHDQCLEHLQLMDNGEPEDLLGSECPSPQCATSINNSVIVEVSVIGSDGFDNPLTKFCLNTPRDKSSNKVNSISRPFSSNGSPVKSCVSTSMGGSQAGVTSSRDAPDPAVKNVTVERKTTAMAKVGLPFQKAPWTPHPPQYYGFPPLPPRPPTPFPVPNPLMLSGSHIHQHLPFFPNVQALPNQAYHFSRFSNQAPLHFSPPYAVRPHRSSTPAPRFQSLACYPSPSTSRTIAQTPTPPPPSACVEVVVKNKSVLKAGATLFVPITSQGGPVQVLPPSETHPTAVTTAATRNLTPSGCVEVVVQSKTVLNPGSALFVPISPEGGPVHVKSVPSKPDDEIACKVAKTASYDCVKSESTTSIVADFKRNVKKLAEDSGGEIGLQSGVPMTTTSKFAKPSEAAVNLPSRSAALTMGAPLINSGTVITTTVQLMASYEPPKMKWSSSEARCNVTATYTPKVTERPLNPVVCSVNQAVEDFRRVVRELAGKPSQNVICKKSNQPSSSCTTSEVSMKQVFEEFKKLGHDEQPEVNRFTTLNHKNIIKQDRTADILCRSSLGSLSLPISVVSTLPSSHCMINPKSLRAQSHHFMTQSSSAFQAKSKLLHQSHEVIVIPSSIIATFCTPQDDVLLKTFTKADFEAAKEAINKCRTAKFGYEGKNYVSPELPCFGRPFEQSSSYVEPEEIGMADKDLADFVFSYYQTIFDKDGIYRIEDLQESWTTNCSEVLDLPKRFTDHYTSVAEFLLSSEKFAAIDDVIATSDRLPDMFLKAEAEITESVKYLLFTQPSNSFYHYNATSTNETFISKIRNNNCSPPALSVIECCSESSDGYDQSEPSRDDNDNAIFINSLKSNPPGINGEIKPPCSKPEVVYMSDDDEEIETSLVSVDEHSATPTSDEPILDQPTGCLNLSGGISKPQLVNQDSQTEQIVDAKNEKLFKERDMLLKEINQLKYEKSELHQRLEQMEESRAIQESQHSKAILQIQQSHQAMEEDYKKIQEKTTILDEELHTVKGELKDNKTKISELESILDKTRRTNAKEINNFVKRLQSKEEEFQSHLKEKDELYIKLWKEFCDYKINKFNNLCNDRINVLSQLKEMMSDSTRPTKTEMKKCIEKYEEEMISVALKNSEVNEIYNQETEKLSSGNQIHLPSLIDLPEMKNVPYPPEGAFEYLQSMLKPKQDEFGIPRNHFSQTSRFYPARLGPSNSQLSQTREPEAFSTISNSSLFGQHNETSNLWNNFPAPSATSSVLPFDVSNSNSNVPHLPLQGFGVANSLIPPQLSLMYQPQSPSVPSLIGQSRATPGSSLAFSSAFPAMNGTAFHSSAQASTPSAVGSRAPAAMTVQKPVPSATPPTPILKNATSAPSPAPAPTPALAVSVASAASVSSLGAMSKPRVQTAAAAMTPIVPSKPTVRLGVKQPKIIESNYERLMRNLQKMFPTCNDSDLTQALKIAREKNGNTLSSLTHAEIVAKVDEVLQLHKQAKHTSMGWEKFGKAAWGTAKAPVVKWEGSEQDECPICMTAMQVHEIYTLECKHVFHKECIRKWLVQDSVCPNCRTHSTMSDEFPPLG